MIDKILSFHQYHSLYNIYHKPEQYEDIIIRANSEGEMLRLKDIADVELGRQSYAMGNKVNGHDAVTCIVFQMAGSNATQTISDIEVLLNEADPPEPIVDGAIDLGGITLEFLALALDPYPRKPGASFESSAGDTGIESPFAALAKLKRGD